ncbi:hypothetical protein BPOR_0713g00020 [Botrytis porri]|uniref:DNA2/NAM7 helicase helicase domain-containing protein n=1 Tax=Botrytis porri TaxID=87229 RepID=A0A4Z1KBP0_9HELO|nr:hypothetical protein BPOR_0713g00020 [Botrytis porri]
MVPLKNNYAPKKGNKEGLSWRIRNPTIAGPNVESTRNSNSLEELILFKEDATRPVSGKDKPSGPYIRQNNRAKKVMVVIHPMKSTASIKESTAPILFDKLSTFFDFSSQFHVHNFALANVDSTVQTADDCIFKHLIFGVDNPANWSIASIRSEFAGVFDTPDLTFDQAVELYKFGRGLLDEKADDNVNGKARVGFFALNFTKKGRVSPPRLCDSCVTNKESEVRALKFQRILKKGNFVFNWSATSETVAMSWMLTGNTESQFVHNKGYGRFSMATQRRTQANDSRIGIRMQRNSFPMNLRWLRLPVKRTRTGFKEWEIVLSAAVIHDVAASVKLNEQYYNWDRTYEAIVRTIMFNLNLISQVVENCPSLRLMGELDFSLNMGAEDSNVELENDENKVEHGRTAEQVETEAYPGATNITSSQENIETNVIDKSEDDQSICEFSEDKAATQDVVIDGINNIEWTAHILVAKINRQFVISFVMHVGKKRKFHPGSKVNVQLKVLNNRLATTRQLKAIGMIAENKAKDDIYGRILQRFILGEGMADIKDDIEDHLLSLKEITYNQLPLLNQKLENCNLDRMQREAYDAVIEVVLPVKIIQGQSGTGKSFTTALTYIRKAQLGYKVLYATPTNAAAETALLSIFMATQKLFRAVDNQIVGVNPAPELLPGIEESKENFGIVHFPANASTVNDFMKRDDERKDDEEDDPLDAHRISN